MKDVLININTEQTLYESHKKVFDDIVYHLNKLPNVQAIIQMRPDTTDADYSIVVTDSEDLPSDGQSFSIKTDDENCRINGQTPYGFQNGLYYFLEELGYRWYMPGEVWTIIPTKLNWPTITHEVITPDFRDRSYFGTGGWGGKKLYDPNDSIRNAFNVWNRRNRISATYHSSGHSGKAFYNKHKKYLNEHPEFFCNGKPNPNSKLNLSHTDLVKYIIDQKTKNINWSTYQTIGMDPHDGSGGKDDCLESPTGIFDNYSDKYFWIANEVAKKIPESAKTLVDLYAYNNHAQIPSFQLDEKVFPMIIPYAFQHISPPKQYIRNWAEFQNGKPLGVYDYWNITQWSKDLPQFNIYSIPKKLDFWKANQISSIRIESTWAKGPMGHAWWLFSKYAWDTTQEFEGLYQQFLEDCFGAGADDVKRMYDRWSINYQGSLESGLSLADLEQARSKTHNDRIHRRLDEITAYVVYIDKYNKYINQRKATSYNNLIDFIKGIHSFGILQTDALIRRYIPKPPREDIVLEPRRKENIDNVITQSKEQIKKYSYAISNFNLDVRTLKPCTTQTVRNAKAIIGSNKYRFYVSHRQEVTFEMGTTKRTIDAVILDVDGQVIGQKEVIAGKNNELTTTFTIKLETGVYTLKFGAYYQNSVVKFPKNMVFIGSSKWYHNSAYPVHFVYVPADVDYIIYHDGPGPGMNNKGYWLDTNGDRYDPEKIALNTYRIKVPPDQKGKVWKLVMGHRSWRLLNIPNVYSVNCFKVDE